MISKPSYKLSAVTAPVAALLPRLLRRIRTVSRCAVMRTAVVTSHCLMNPMAWHCCPRKSPPQWSSEEHTSELQSRFDVVCRLLLDRTAHEDERQGGR